jgi:hypothetical protein
MHEILSWFQGSYSLEKEHLMFRCGAGIVVVGALLGSFMGCGKVAGLNEEKNWSMEPGGIKSVTIDAPKKDQQLKISMNSGNVSVSVFVVLEKNHDALEKELVDGKAVQTPTLAIKERVRDVNFSVTVPAGNEVAVVVGNVGGNPTSVKLKIAEE